MQLGDVVVQLDIVCGCDALPIMHQSNVIPKDATHLSFTILQYGEQSQSAWLCHLLALYSTNGKSNNLQQYLTPVMIDVITVAGDGRIVTVGAWSAVVKIVPHMAADLACL